LFILKNLGHSVIGLDIDRVPLFGELLELFGVRESFIRSTLSSRCRTSVNNSIGSRRSLRILPLSSGKKRWGTAEWDFFLRDLQHHLAPGGKIFFGLNPSYNGGYYTPEIRDLFLSRGADVERERILFENGVRF
jgi:hypothetical protein